VWNAPHLADAGSGTYTNDKNNGWQYDADGRLVDAVETQYTFDASGRKFSVVGDGGTLTQEQVFDGDGRKTKLFSQQNTFHEDTYTWSSETKTQYFVTSSVLGKVVTELDQSGQKTRTFVYHGGKVLAWQQKAGPSENITREHRDASNATAKFPGIMEGEGVAELEPMGGNAGSHPPIVFPGLEPPSLSETRSYPALADLSGGQCNLEGMPIPCSELQDRMDAGFVAAEYTGLTDGPDPRPIQREIIPQGLGLFRINNAPIPLMGTTNQSFSVTCTFMVTLPENRMSVKLIGLNY
jgi:hypothetical protein